MQSTSPLCTLKSLSHIFKYIHHLYIQSQYINVDKHNLHHYALLNHHHIYNYTVMYFKYIHCLYKLIFPYLKIPLYQTVRQTDRQTSTLHADILRQIDTVSTLYRCTASTDIQTNSQMDNRMDRCSLALK